MKRQTLAFVSLLIFSLQSWAFTLVVSDLDDTLKISHVLSTVGMVDNSIAYKNHFTGMSELYQSMGKEQKVIFAYVSNSPEALMYYPHRQFLFYNRFPDGYLYLRPDILDENHKFETISHLVDTMKPDSLILIGDNGEMDPVIYKAIEAKYDEIPSRTFIHQVYSVLSSGQTGRALQSGQVGYSTSVDLAVLLREQGAIREDDFHQFVSKIVPRILKEKMHLTSGEIAFPQWMDCRDYLKDYLAKPYLGIAGPSQELLLDYEKKMKARCANPL